MSFIGGFRTEMRTALGATTAFGALTLSSANIIVGYDNQTAGDEFVKNVSTSAPTLYIRPAYLIGIDSQTLLRKWTVPIDLYFGIVRVTDNTMVDAEGLLEAILTKWDDPTNFSTHGTPAEYRTSEPDFDTRQSPVMVHYQISADVTACG